MKQTVVYVILLMSISLSAQDIYDVSELEIKPSATDYAPVLYEDGFVMSSLRHRDQVIQYTEKGSGKPFADMYYVEWDGTNVGSPRIFDEKLATPVHDGPATFSPSGDTICFTRNLIVPQGHKDRLSKQNKLGLFFAVRTSDGWGDPIPFEFNSTEFSISHPSFRPDGKRIYFTSADPSGYGGSDIFYSDLKSGKWSNPTNAGDDINTSNSEIFPHCAGMNVLYFSSNREGGPGALDIYVIENREGRWEKPVCLPEPVNSKSDDLGFATDKNQMQGLFSSNRTGDDKIFAFRRTTPPFTDCKPQRRTNFCYMFQDVGNFKNPNGLPLEYRWNMGDGTYQNSTIAKHCFSEPGTYFVELEIVDKNTQKVFFTEATYTLVVEDVFQPVITINDSLRAGKEITFTAADSKLPGVDISSYHWDFGDGQEAWGIEHSHKFKEEGTYDMRLDVLGKPNATGHIQNYCVIKKVNVIRRFKDSEDAPGELVFMKASEQISEFNYRELPFDGFELAVVEGEDIKFTLELITSSNRMDLNDPYFAKVRNTYEVIERYDPKRGVFAYSVGKADNLEEAYKIYEKLMEWQYLESEVLAMKMEKLKNLKDLNLDLETVEEYNNTVLTASNVYFDVGKATFKPVFAKQLNKLIELMEKYPNLSLVISAHTDSDGARDFNQQLSEQRAQMVTQYFMIEDVDASRLKSIGYGEDHPVVANDSEKNKKLNRRVEFKITLDDKSIAESK